MDTEACNAALGVLVAVLDGAGAVVAIYVGLREDTKSQSLVECLGPKCCTHFSFIYYAVFYLLFSWKILR